MRSLRLIALRTAAFFVVSCVAVSFATACGDLRQFLIGVFAETYAAEGSPSRLQAQFTELDLERQRFALRLTEIAANLPMITDLQFAPERHDALFVTCKGGEFYVVELGAGAGSAAPRLIQKFPVTTNSEQGLLGVALHPQFRRNGLMYFNYTLKRGGQDISRVAERRYTNPKQPFAGGQLVEERVLMEVDQPYQNHNAGQLAFGPDGKLFIGWGDGGWRADPERNGQNPRTLLGAMLRIDPMAGKKTDGKARPYAIPADNPYADGRQAAPEIFATGLRNPWRFSFDPKGRLIVADVGQDRYEEVDVVRAGGNYGWDLKEGAHCHRPERDCASTAANGAPLMDPVYEYGRVDGRSITGGYVYTGARMGALKNRYVFGDFVTGRIWAIALPDDDQRRIPRKAALALGKWPLLISTFGRDTRGEIYVADFSGGKVYRLDPAP